MEASVALTRLLARHRRRESLAGMLRLFAWVAAAQILALAALAWFSVRNPLSTAWLHGLLAVYAALLLLPACWLFAWTRRGNAPAAAARALDRANPGAPDPFQTSLSLGNHGAETRRELEALFARHLGRLVLPRPRVLPGPQRAALLAAIAAFAAAAALSGRPADFLRRAAAPWQALGSLPILRFAVEPPPAALGAGDTLRLRGRVLNRLEGQPLYAHVRSAAGEARYPLRPEGGEFEFRHGPVDGDFSVQLSAANGRSAAYRIRVLPLPFLESLRAVVTPPAYTRLRPDTLPPGVANFPVLPGSRVRWSVRADRELGRAVWEGRDSAAARADTLGAGREFVVEREVRSPLAYAFRLEDERGIRSRAAAPGRVDLLPDHPPEIEILAPAADGPLDRNLRVPLAFRVQDDYGVASLKLAWRLLSDGQVKAEGTRDARDWLRSAAAGLVETEWRLEGLEPRPENVLEFHLVAVDNDSVNGPKASRSAVRSLRLPSVQEVMAASRRQEQSAMANLKSAIERERRIERKREREGQRPREEGPPALAGYEIDRIMVDNPRDQARRLEAALAQAERSLERAGRQGAQAEASAERKAARAAVEEMREFLRRSDPALPRGDQGSLPLEERRKNLDALMRVQKEQEKRLEQLQARLARDPRAAELPRPQADAAARELKRNLEAQADLKKAFDDEAYQARARSELQSQAAEEQVRMAEDMKKALDDIQQTLEQSRKNGLMTEELADKMRKIQDLLREVLPDSVQDLMEKKLAGQEVDPRELRDQIQKVLGKPGELGDNLNRALAMLEQLRDRKRLEELRQSLAELEARERELAARIGSDKAKPSDLAAEQKAIQEDARAALEDFAAQSEGRQALERARESLEAGPVQKDMQGVREALAQGGGKPSRSRASAAAKSAADKLSAMQAGLGEAMGGMEGGVDLAAARELLRESLELSRLQLLLRTGAARRRAAGWEADEPALYATVAQTAGWLNERVKALAATIPFFGASLTAESRNFHAAAQEAAGRYTWDAGEKSLHYNQNLSRELLKLIKMAESMQGSGGAGSAGGGQPSSNPGGGGAGSGGGLSQQLKGLSGKQMAINQATQQLLQAMLDGRRPGRGAAQAGGQDGQGGSGPGAGGMPGMGPGMGMEPGGMPGADGSPGGGPGGDGMPGSPGEGMGGGGRAGGGGLQGMGNRQGELGESLETLAEALSEEAGGAGGAQKVRKLAEEARELEEAMRQGRLAPEEVRQRQERFQSRLLEAANALEERGMSEERKAETRKDGAREAAEAPAAAEARLLKLLRAARRDARELRLDPAQRRHLDEYYESLLTR